MQENESLDKDVLLALFEHHNNEVISRREPEFTYTAAAVAGLGGIAWGIAALVAITDTTTKKGPIVAALLATLLGVILLVLALARKILHDHSAYIEVRKAQQDVISQLLPSTELSVLPKGFMSKNPGTGYRGSIWIIAMAAIPAVGFCGATLWRLWPW